MLLRLLYVIDQAAGFGNVLDEARQGRRMEGVACRLVDDFPRVEVDGEDIAGFDFFDVVADFQGPAGRRLMALR